jgi:hypothetical protein
VKAWKLEGTRNAILQFVNNKSERWEVEKMVLFILAFGRQITTNIHGRKQKEGGRERKKKETWLLRHVNRKTK